MDILSPLPPVRSGISDYTLDLLPELSRRADLRLVLLPDQPVEPTLLETWPTITAEDWQQEEPGQRVPLYQMGNNHYHRAIWSLAMQRPGVLVLHDLVLHHFLIERTVSTGDFEGYSAALEASHGWIGAAASRPLFWPGGIGTASQFALPAHGPLLARQKGVLVHSRWARDTVSEELPGLRIRDIPMGMPLPAQPDASTGRDFRRSRGIPEHVALLGSYGFQTPIKRTDVVIRALTHPGLENVHLMIAGQAAAGLDLAGMAAAAGVGDRVHILGFLAFDDFEAAIAASDLALNLRYPTAGETSASLLRILALGRPAVVSDHAQMADLPPAGLIRVPLGEGEDRLLARQLEALLADPESLAKLGEEARRQVETNHRLDEAARAVAEACREWRDLDPPSLATRTEEPPTSLAWSDLPGSLEVEGAELPWQAGERRRLRLHLRNDGACRWLAGERLGGGIALQIKLLVEGQDVRSEKGWIGLPQDLEPGQDHIFELELRRPLAQSVRLELIPHVLGFTSLGALGGPLWTRDL